MVNGTFELWIMDVQRFVLMQRQPNQTVGNPEFIIPTAIWLRECHTAT